MEDIKIVKPLEESGLLIEGISETIENEAIEQKDRFLPMLFGTLAVEFIRNCIHKFGTSKSRWRNN